MKKLGICFFLLFLFTAAAYAVIQSQIGKNWIQNAIASGLQESGFKVTIGQIQGTLPHQIDLKNVSIQGHGLDLKVQELKLRPILWRLLKKELAFNDVQAKEIFFSQGKESFDFNGKFRINKHKAHVNGTLSDWEITLGFNRQTKAALFTARNETLFAKGKALFTPDFQLLSTNIQVGVDFIERGWAHIQIEQEEEGYKGKASWQIPHLKWDGKGEATYKEGALVGSFTIEPLAKGSFDLLIENNGLIRGTSQIEIANLQALSFPNTYGSLKVDAEWGEADGTQTVEMKAEATDLYYESFFAQTLSAHADWKNPFHALQGPISIETKAMKWNEIAVATANFQTALGETNAPFKLFAEGEAFELYVDGTWEGNLSANIDNCNGTYLGTPFALEEPVVFKKGEETLQISDAHFTVGKGVASFKIDRQNQITNAEVHLDQIPLGFFSLNPLDLPLKGTVTLDALMKEKGNQLEGDFKAFFHQTAPFVTDGKFQGNFSRDRLGLKGDLSIYENPLLQVEASIPIHFSLWPFEAEVLFHKESQGRISCQGRVEKFLDFFNIGPHRLEGECQGEIQFSNTLYRPLVQGNIFFKDGFYENYYSGTKLHDIQAEFFAEKNILYLRKLTAVDRLGSGNLTADGEMHLLQSDLYPFHLNVDFNHLQFVDIDLVEATTDGQVRIDGNALSSVAKGDLLIEKCTLTIPDHIPHPLPHLNVVYRNPLHPVILPEKAYTPYPLHLELNVSTPTAVSISGRGLSSEWKGEFHLGGTATSLAAKGKLELQQGEFNFSSRSFKLKEGLLSLSGIEHEMPHLNITATTETKGIQITARLNGPLNNPQITLQSSPPLPMGSIMSYLLFGQDISEIGGFQALEIASSLASLAGTGPDVMENTRRSLGIDRLRVISDPNAEGGETVSIQVGKYVAKGVLVTLTQGPDESSTNISVEIELKNNFVFQIESDQDQEQGKFTLKWSLNY